MLDSLSDLSRGDILALGPLNDNSKWLLTSSLKEAVVRALALQPKVTGHQTFFIEVRYCADAYPLASGLCSNG